MKQTLRAKLIASHTLPFLVLMPVLALFLLYTLEGFFEEQLVQQLTYQAQLIQDRAQRNPMIFQSPQAAQNFLTEISTLTGARVVLLSPESTILASTRKADANLIGTLYSDAAVTDALRGEMGQGVGPGFSTEVGYAVLPLRSNGVIRGALRLSYEIDDMRTQFSQLRWIVLVGVLFTGLIGLGVGWGLATTITRPLRALSASVRQIAAGDYRARAPIHTQDEVGQLAQNFNQMAVHLEETEQARLRQLAAIVHELSRPLAGMRAALETLRDFPNTATDVRDSFLSGVMEETARLERLLGTLRGVAQGAFRPIQLKRTEISLPQIIQASISNFKSIAAESGIALEMDLPNRLPILRADEDRLIPVLTNLLDNALKFTPRGGRVSIVVEEDQNVVQVRVVDTGVGIAPEEMPALFQQFYRGSQSRPPEKRGMGLGLAISREIIIAHGGTMRAENVPGGGACFVFTLPKN